jgi:hypothetical protein
VGRPNLINIQVWPVQEDKSLHWKAGCNFHFVVKNLWVWSYLDVYPGRVEINCAELSPNLPVKIGDVEKMLPYGMYLHKKYKTQKFHSVVRLTETNAYVARRNMVIEQAEKIRE